MEPLEVKCKGIPYGIMTWWKKVDDAARYLIYLYIAEKKQSEEKFNEIAFIEKDRHTLYHTFDGLAKIDKEYDAYRGCWCNTGLNYYISVSTEDRNGNIISESSTIKCVVENG